MEKPLLKPPLHSWSGFFMRHNDSYLHGSSLPISPMQRQNLFKISSGIVRAFFQFQDVLRRALSAALAGNGCGCFVPDLTRLTMPQCAGARRHTLYLICAAAIHIPSSCQMLSMRRLMASVMVIGVPHSRLVSPGHLLVASIPILLPRPLTGEAKSR